MTKFEGSRHLRVGVRVRVRVMIILFYLAAYLETKDHAIYIDVLFAFYAEYPIE